MSGPSNYLLRLRAEREQRDRKAQSAAQQTDKLLQDRRQMQQRESGEQAARGRLREKSQARRDAERQQQLKQEEQRRALLEQIHDQRRKERLRGDAAREQRAEQLRQLSSSIPESPHASARELPSRENPRLQASAAARAQQAQRQEAERLRQETQKQQQAERVCQETQKRQAERLRQEALARVAQERRQQQQRASEKAREQAKMRAAALEKARSARAAPKRLPAPMQPATQARAAATSRHPLRRVTRPPARATETRPSSLPIPPIPEDVPLSWLSTQGAFIVDENQNPVYLRGVTIEGFDTASPALDEMLPDALAMDDENLGLMEDVWGVNLIRIPFSSSSILHGNDTLSSDDLLAGLDDVVAEAAAAGCYVLLALRAAPDNPGLPSDEDYICWRELAIRYQDEPTVLYEAYVSDAVLPQNWLGIAQAVIGTIRREHTASLLFVGNRYGTADVSGFPMTFLTGDPIQNLVYTFRLSPESLNTVNRAQLQNLAHDYPVFVSQWSDGGADFARTAELSAGIVERCAIGWAASSWNVEPKLVAGATAHHFGATRWGLLVQRALAQPVRPLLAPFS